ncbi:MAG: hypothetical protein HRT61_10470 [Ekhidna sp.]|nr:hypothetical protein [Ekhidna sp.]
MFSSFKATMFTLSGLRLLTWIAKSIYRLLVAILAFIFIKVPHFILIAPFLWLFVKLGLRWEVDKKLRKASIKRLIAYTSGPMSRRAFFFIGNPTFRELSKGKMYKILSEAFPSFDTKAVKILVHQMREKDNGFWVPEWMLNDFQERYFISSTRGMPRELEKQFRTNSMSPTRYMAACKGEVLSTQNIFVRRSLMSSYLVIFSREDQGIYDEVVAIIGEINDAHFMIADQFTDDAAPFIFIDVDYNPGFNGVIEVIKDTLPDGETISVYYRGDEIKITGKEDVKTVGSLIKEQMATASPSNDCFVEVR